MNSEPTTPNEMYDEKTGTYFTGFNASDTPNGYDVSGFLLNEEVITEEQYDEYEMPNVMVYVVDGPITIEFYLDRGKAIAAYNDIPRGA